LKSNYKEFPLLYVTEVTSVKEVEEDVHGRKMPKVVAQDREGPYEGPAIGVKLGRGHLDLRQECPLEARKRQTEFDLLEDGAVEEEKYFPVVGAIVSAHKLTLRTGLNGYVRIAFSPKHATHTSGLVLPMLYHIPARGKRGGLGKKFVRGPRV